MHILHISDFHLTQSNLLKSQKLIDNMLSTIKGQNLDIDLVIFTGDMVDRGGNTFENIDKGFQIFNNLIIKKILTELNISTERFMFCPGNHDIDRKKINPYAETGLLARLTDVSTLDAFFDNSASSSEVMHRIDSFKSFENKYYSSLPNIKYIPSRFQSNFIVTIGDETIGITALNSSWRCSDSDTDKGAILMGVRQILDSEPILKDCTIKIALSHHSYTWMNDFEVLQLEKYLTNNYDMYFCGHTHSPNAEFCIKPEGKMFKLVAPGVMSANVFESNTHFRNGFTIIDFDLEHNSFENRLYYQNDLSIFTQDKNHGDNGIWHVDIPLGPEQKRRKDIQDIIINIKEELENLNQHLLSYNANTCAPKSFRQIFVMPNLTFKKPINSQKDNQEFEEEKNNNIDFIVDSDNNYILFGIKESGKTILLDRILLELLNKRNGNDILPAYIKFNNIKGDLERNIRGYWHQNKTLSSPLIEDCKLVLLIDDMDFSDQEKMDTLKAFIDKHPNSRFIGTCLEVQKNDLILDSYNYSDIEYERIEIDEFNSKQIRLLAEKWIGENSKEKSQKVEFLIDAFSAVDLPRTPFAVSMFLWILERQENYKPQNNAILIKQFLETLLQSNEIKGALREQFDYINKCSLLAIIAKGMLDADNINYSLPSSKVIEIIEKHFEELKFKFYIATKELNNFLDLGILVEELQGNITFRFSCFFEYYLYVYMEKDLNFKNFVLNPDNSLKFCNEIIYYTGINRGEWKILTSIIDTLEYDYIDINDIVFKRVSCIDDFFNVDKSILQNITADDLIKVLPEKQTIEEKEFADDRKMNKNTSSKRQGIIERKDTDKFTNYGKILLLAMNILKNSEEIKEDNLKSKCFTILLRNSISYMVLFKMICGEMIKHSSSFPQARIEELKFCVRFLPILHEELLRNNLGTFKLTQVIIEKIDQDLLTKNISEMERFLSVFLYIDLNGFKSDKVLLEFIKSFNRAYIADACFLKLWGYYYSSKDSRLDQVYMNALSELYIRIHSSASGKKLDKSKVIKLLTHKRDIDKSNY